MLKCKAKKFYNESNKTALGVMLTDIKGDDYIMTVFSFLLTNGDEKQYKFSLVSCGDFNSIDIPKIHSLNFPFEIFADVSIRLSNGRCPVNRYETI